ncbi:MAG: rod shape-determining protein MreD [Clostridia bacterium]|nr:rod shape-determining protein MreD [Clostridia bacterium]
MSLRYKSVMLAVVILLQLTVLSHFTPFGIIPNYILVFTLAVCIICDSVESVVFAACIGLLADMLTGAPMGLNTIIYMYLAIFAVAVTGMVYTKSIKVVTPMCFIGAFLYELIFGVLSSLMRGSAFYPEAIFRVILPSAFINTLIFIPVYFVLSKLRFEKRRKGIKYERQI